MFGGRNDRSFFTSAMACASSLATKWMLPLTVACAVALPTSSIVVDSPVAEFGVALWEPESVVDLTEHSSAIAVEAARTDAAFDVWMSVAPAASPAAIPTAVAVAVAVADARPSTELVPIDSRGRPRARWAGSLEVLAALIGATGLLVLVLLLVG